MTTEVLTQPVLPTGVERRVSPRGMTTLRRPVGGPAATTRNEAPGRAPVLRPGIPSVAAGQLGAWRSVLTRPGLRLVASTTLRNLFLITVAMLLIFVLLPALLSAQWASVG
jgi:hypothetical protein